MHISQRLSFFPVGGIKYIVRIVLRRLKDMSYIDYKKPCHVHFIGIGGISMSGLADILFDKGFTISGSDSKASELTDKLSAIGITIHIGQTAANITDDIDLVVYTAAVHEDNEEFKAAKEKNIPMITRAVLLGEIMTNYKVAIGVSGTHGKTTTTSMLTEILIEAGLDPTVSVGGILPSIGGNLRIGNSGNFITEACEYTNSFLSFFPTIEIILNIEEDHMDFFKDINDIRNSFSKYVNLLPESGFLIINNDIDNVSDIYKEAKCPVVTVGSTDSADYTAHDIKFNETGCCSYTLMHKNDNLGKITLGVPGLHNVYNSLAAIAVALLLDASLSSVQDALLNFHGTNRRFEKKGELNGFTIIDDYAHHPAEIRATLNSAKNYPHNRLTVIFQPHTYTRTKAFLSDFADALSTADLVILADIYAARETDTLGISSDDIRKLIEDKGTECLYIPSFDEIQKTVLKRCTEKDLVITMGAGNIYEVGEALLNQ